MAWFTGLHRLGDFANACGQWDFTFSDGSMESRKSLAKTVLIFSAVRDHRAHVHLWVFAANEFFPDSMSASGCDLNRSMQHPPLYTQSLGVALIG